MVAFFVYRRSAPQSPAAREAAQALPGGVRTPVHPPVEGPRFTRANVVVIPNSVPVPALAQQEPEPGRILFLGQVEPRKGIYELLEALALLRERFPHVQLAIGGQGELEKVKRRALEVGVASHITELGWVTAQRKQEELARASIFCLPSHAEGLPMALLEAMAAGKAVVSTGVGGIPDALRDGDNGLMVETRAPDAFYGRLPQLSLEDGLAIKAVYSDDDNLEAVFKYLVNR